MFRGGVIVLLGLVFAGSFGTPILAAGSAKYFLLVVWDGMRPDFVSPDLMVVSDHGFSTIAQNGDVAATLRAAGINARPAWDESPQRDDVVVVGNGGSVLLYVVERSAAKIERNFRPGPGNSTSSLPKSTVSVTWMRATAVGVHSPGRWFLIRSGLPQTLLQ